MLSIDDFVLRFEEEPGYLDYARVGPLGRAAAEEEQAQVELLRRARFGSLDSLEGQDERVRAAVAALTGFRADQVVFQPNTSSGLMHAMFGLGGTVLLSPDDFPSSPFAAVRASDALGALTPQWLDVDYGGVTAGAIKQQLTKETTAVVVSLVDFRTGRLVDLEGIRQVTGDRLLIVDAIQGFTVADVDYGLADVVASGGQKWARSGWSTGFMALSDRAADRIRPIFSGFNATDDGPMPLGTVPHPARGARAFQVSNPSPIAEARFAAALEEIAEVGVAAIAERISTTVSRVIDLADEFGVPVVSARDERERAGIVVLEPAADQFTVLVASLYNQGVTATSREGTVRLSVHATTTEETLGMLREAFQAFTSATTI